MLNKGKSSPKLWLTIPRRGHKGTVVRPAKFAEGAITRRAGRITHPVDSSTILCYLQEEAQKWKLYEGVRVAERVRWKSASTLRSIGKRTPAIEEVANGGDSGVLKGNVSAVNQLVLLAVILQSQFVTQVAIKLKKST